MSVTINMPRLGTNDDYVYFANYLLALVNMLKRANL